MRPAGLAAYAKRTEENSAVYGYEQRESATLGDEFEQRFKEHKAAWRFFEAQPASYRKGAIWWVVSAKKAETRLRRLAALIDDSANGRTIPLLTRPRGADDGTGKRGDGKAGCSAAD